MAPRRRLAALAFALVGVALLVALGVWQLQRRTVKEALIAQVEARAGAPVLPFSDAMGLLRAGLDGGLALGDGANPAVYRRVRVRGRLLHGREFHVLTATREGPAWTVMTVLVLAVGLGPPLQTMSLDVTSVMGWGELLVAVSCWLKRENMREDLRHRRMGRGRHHQQHRRSARRRWCAQSPTKRRRQ